MAITPNQTVSAVLPTIEQIVIAIMAKAQQNLHNFLDIVLSPPSDHRQLLSLFYFFVKLLGLLFQFFDSLLQRVKQLQKQPINLQLSIVER